MVSADSCQPCRIRWRLRLAARHRQVAGYFPDSLPSNLDIGLGSPTAIAFGTNSHFPEAYRNALFILDWAYGKIFAVHLTPDGASYRGRFEEFVTGRPLNVTGADFGPDGAFTLRPVVVAHSPACTEFASPGSRRRRAGFLRLAKRSWKPRSRRESCAAVWKAFIAIGPLRDLAWLGKT